MDLVVKDIRQSTRDLLLALSNNLRASDNFAADGQVGQVLTSRGLNAPPSWQWPAAAAEAAAMVTLAGLGGVPLTRMVAGHSLAADVVLTAADIYPGTFPGALGDYYYFNTDQVHIVGPPASPNICLIFDGEQPSTASIIEFAGGGIGDWWLFRGSDKSFYLASGAFQHNVISAGQDDTDPITLSRPVVIPVDLPGPSGSAFYIDATAAGGHFPAFLLAPVASGGLVRIYADTGDMEIGAMLKVGGSFTTDGGLQTFGANDSGGSGKRLVLVPNA